MGDDRPAGGDRGRDPLRLSMALAAGGLVWLALGRVTVVPFLEDERRRENVRAVWREATRHLPETAFPSVMAMVFWLCAAGVLVGGIALAVVVGRIDSGEPAASADPDAGRAVDGTEA